MKKLPVIIITLMISLWAPTTLAADLTLTKPPIIPVGTDEAQSKDANIATIKLPGVGSEQGGKALQESVLPTFTNIVISTTGGLALLFVIIGGIQMLTAFGNEDKVGQGKKTLTWALVGLVISILSYAIVQIIVSIKI